MAAMVGGAAAGEQAREEKWHLGCPWGAVDIMRVSAGGRQLAIGYDRWGSGS